MHGKIKGNRGLGRLLVLAGCAGAVMLGASASSAIAAAPQVIGPVYPLPGYADSAHQTHGGDTCVGQGSIEAGTLKWSFGGSALTTAPSSSPSTCSDTGVPPPFDTTRFQSLYWGLNLSQPNQFSVACTGPECVARPTASGPMTYDAADSTPATGVLVYQGSGDPADKLHLTFKDSNGLPVELTDATTIGSFHNADASALGFVVAVTPQLTTFNVTAAYTSNGSPMPTGNCTCQTHSDITGGFYWVDRPPTGDFSTSSANHQPATLTAGTLSDPDGTVASYSWDLNGDGTYGDDPNVPSPSTPALGPGTYTVGLEMVDNDGSVTDVIHQLTITNQAPAGSISIAPPGSDPPGNHRSATFQASVSDPDQGTSAAPTYSWDLAGGTTYGQDPNSDAAASFGPGTHTVALLVTDSDGATTRVEKTFTITNAPPVASFSCTPATIVAGQTVTCTASASDPDAAPGDPALTQKWSFNGATASGGVASFTLPAGSDPVSLQVIDQDGGTTTVSHTLVVQKPTSTPPPTGTLAASAKLVGGQKLKTALKQGIRATFTANEASTGRFALTLAKAQAKRLHLTGNLWTGAPALRAAGSTKFAMTLSAAAARKLRKAGHASFVLAGIATDGAGHRVTVHVGFSL